LTNYQIPHNFGALIARRRRYLNLTQEELADLSRLSRPHLSKVERGKWKNLRLRTVLRLAETLNLSLDWLFLAGKIAPRRRVDIETKTEIRFLLDEELSDGQDGTAKVGPTTGEGIQAVD
jgi:transcriptional regulator with XRE-family HTH domain